MHIGIIGIGNVGGTLGRRWARKGHGVMFGVREPASEKVGRMLAEAGKHARAGTVAEAAAYGDAVVLATPWDATRDALGQAGDLTGKVLLDCTNPLKPDLSGLAVGDGTSGGEQVAAWAPGALVVKIFNTTGANNMDNPRFRNDRATMFYCGDHAEAKRIAARLAEDLSFEAVDAGPLAAASHLEHLALFWIHLAYVQQMGRDMAFRLMRR